MSRIDDYFGVSRRGSTYEREIRGGLATFFTMAYIVVLNPLIIGTRPDNTGYSLGVPRVAAATALVAGLMTLLMGIVGRYPFAIAAGLGLNAFVTFTLVVGSQLSWPAAMGLVVIEGLIITALVLTGFRTAVLRSIPTALKTAISVGIGLFIALIGFVDAGFVRRTGSGPVPVELGIFGRLNGWPTVVFIFGLLLTAVLVARRVRGAILLSIIATTGIAIIVEAAANVGPSFISPTENNPSGWQLNVPTLPEKIFQVPDLSLLGDFSLGGAFSQIGVVAAMLFIFSLMLSDFFDTMGTVVGVGAEGDMLDDKGELPGIDRVLLVDSLAAVAGGAASTSSNTTYIESAAGVGEGARTGLANVVTGSLFLLALFVTPLVSVVPYEAASPALVIVGFLMMTQVKNIPWDDFAIGIPAFLTIVLMPFTYSITNGIGAGFVSYVLIKMAQGRRNEVSWLLWVVAALFVVYFAIDPVERLLT